MQLNYESAWKQLKTFVSDMEGYSRPFSAIGFQAVLYKMEELEKALTTEEPRDDDIQTELSSEKFHDLIEKARKLKPTDSVKKIPQLVKEYPDLADAAEKFSVSDFAEAAKILNEHHLYTDIVNQFVDEKTKEVDKIFFDCFQQYLGCKKADDVFVILTSPVMFHHYNDILPCINAKIAQEVGPLGSPSGVRCIEFEKMTEPAKGSREMLETLRTRWEEVYNEN